jgi:hypothetical protein
MRCILCILFSTFLSHIDAIHCILYIWVYILSMQYIICIAFHTLFSMQWILCIVFYVLYSMNCTLCIVFYALYSMHFSVCIFVYECYAMHFILRTKFYALNYLQSILCIVLYASNSIYFIICILLDLFYTLFSIKLILSIPFYAYWINFETHCWLTNRPTDIVTYRAAITAKKVKFECWIILRWWKNRCQIKRKCVHRVYSVVGRSPFCWNMNVLF